jgi:hypothetical protein
MRTEDFRVGMIVNHITHGHAIVQAVDLDNDVVAIAFGGELRRLYRASPNYLTIVGGPSLTDRPPAKRYGPFKPIAKALP